ncbi:MAG TPA: ABC transporter permease [Anaerolineaceae bacterium]|nr:ABC transporter permease [Anaerolineaceae bacterium]
MNLRKLFFIALKDLRLIFRDPAGLVFMLLAPFALTIGMGALTGRFSGFTQFGISQIPVAIVNQDSGELGKVLEDVFASDEIKQLIAAQPQSDPTAARALVDEGKLAAVIIVPEGFSESIMSGESGGEVVRIEFYENPTHPTSTGIVRSILESFLTQVEVGRVSGALIVNQLLSSGAIQLNQAAAIGAEVGREVVGNSSGSINLITTTAEGSGVKFDILAYLAPGMAMLFLMYTVSFGGRSLLVESRTGTMARMLISPTNPGFILGGKGLGIFLTAAAQLLILIGGTSLLFHLSWGDWRGVALLILAAAFGASGWGILMASVLKTPGQVAITGSAVALLFGVLGGSFFDLSVMPEWVRKVGMITPNSWANDGFRILSMGGKFAAIQSNLIALLIMGAALYTLGTILLSRRGLVRK